MYKVIKILIAALMLFSLSHAESVSYPVHTKTEHKSHNIVSSIWSSIISLFSDKEHLKENKLVATAKEKLGRKYVWGATGKRDTFDCSGLTQYVYKKIGIIIPRTSRYQAEYGKRIARNALQPGDLIFFDTSRRRKGYVNHVGIYIGKGKFLHASSAKKKVVISQLDKTFYGKRFKVARRPS